MRIKRIKWKPNATIDQVRDAEATLCALWECDPSTFPKIDPGDTWTTYPRYAK